MAKRVLIVEDEPDVMDLIEMNLRTVGLTVIGAQSGDDALAKIKSTPPDLIILDLMLPGMSGLEICKLLKKNPETSSIPVLMLTARAEEIDRIVGFEIGADDYVTKPFSPRELVLRVQSILRRTTDSEEALSEKINYGMITLDRSRHEVLIEQKPIILTATEFKLLALLLERRGRVQSRERLLNDVWGYESVIDTRTVDTHVRRLRDKLGKAADYVQTLRGVGYKISDEVPEL